MNLGDLRRRLDHLAGASGTEENRPPQIRFRLAGAVPGVHRCGPALITVVSPEERRPEVERQHAEWERITGRPNTNTVDATLAREVRATANLAGTARTIDRVLGMNSEAREQMLGVLDAKLTTQQEVQ